MTQAMTLPEKGDILPPFTPGVLPGILDSEYHRHDGMSSHRLGSLADGNCPAQLRYDMLNPEDATDDRNMGTAVHTALLEPDLLEAKVVRGLQIPKRSKADKETWASFEMEHHGKIILPFKMYDKMGEMIRMVRDHKGLSKLLDMPGDTELTVAGPCPVTGVPTQIRIDKYIPQIGTFLDLKTVAGKFGSRPNPRRFKSDLGKYGYHRQGRVYTDIGEQQGLIADHYVIGVIQKDPPHFVYLRRLDEQALDIGGIELEQPRRQFAECWDSGEWPDYGTDIEDITVEDWRLRKHGY